MSEPDPPPVSVLMAECLARLSAGGELGLDQVCADHPEEAGELRQRMARLQALGMLGGAEGHDPETVGSFRVAGLLGQGGMGRVYLAQQSEPVRRLVALKVMHAGMDTGRLLDRFDLERQALAALSHPGICQVLEAGATDDGRPWFAMEYVDGAPITDDCDEHALTITERLELFLQVCDAVVHAHQNGIIHRDLKPSNVLVTARLGRPLAKVIDFGVAKALDEAGRDGLKITHAGQIVGTPAYMSPEQAGVTSETVDVRTDVYSLGVMLHELLVGRLPLEPGPDVREHDGAVSEMRRLLRDVETPLPSRSVTDQTAEAAACRSLEPRRWAALLSGDLDWIVTKALAKDRNDRYAAASALADDIRRFLRHEPVMAGPSTRTYRLKRLLRRYRREAVIAGLGVTVLVVSLVVISLQALELEDELDNFNLLAREMQLAELVRRADEDLWPETPAMVPAMDAWRREAAEILAERPDDERILETLRARGDFVDGAWTFAQSRDTYLHDHVEPLLASLSAFEAHDGPVADVEARRNWAARLVEHTVEDHRDAWDRALASIADREDCPAYDGLSIAPQPGLVPLGRDPRSGLWEFAYPRPGASLPTGEPGRWSVGKDTCLVFVLIPGGRLRQGAQDTDPDAPGYLTEVARSERHGRSIQLEPFFLSKYEMTQAQWSRFVGANPSYYGPEHPFVETLTHPVEQVSWTDASRELARLDLALPTGAQWEYAARAGGPAPWWTGSGARSGSEPAPPPGCANLADASCLARMGRSAGIDDFETDYDDGHPVHAPVGAFQPNAFGLHDVIGNVWEWCRDPAYDYEDVVPRAGDGLQVHPGGPDPDHRTRELRGGSFLSTFVKSRSTFRFYQTMESANFVFGVRPSRALHPSSR